MAEEFQAEICGANWWNPTRSVFSPLPSPCSMAGGLGHVDEGFGWPMSHHLIDHDRNKARSNSSGETNNSVCESPNMAFQEVVQKPHHQTDHTVDSTLEIMGFGQPNLAMGRSESNTTSAMYSLLQDDMGAKLSNYKQDHHQTGLATGLPAGSAFFGYDSSTLLQSLFDGDSQQLPFGGRSLNYSSPSYGSNNIPATKPLHFSNNTPFWNAGSDAVLSESNVRPSLHFPPVTQPQQYASPAFEQKPKGNSNLAVSTKTDHMVSRDDVHQELASFGAVKGGEQDQPAVVKRARIETPSPLPTFKVRKEKLGDRITALQQLVSPFGKTDTASVLHEAIEYIKFLHDQVSVLSTPYMKNGTPVQAHQQGPTRMKDQENQSQDLKSRGLCLVPISSTFPVANETTPDFWTPTFGGTFR